MFGHSPGTFLFAGAPLHCEPLYFPYESHQFRATQLNDPHASSAMCVLESDSLSCRLLEPLLAIGVPQILDAQESLLKDYYYANFTLSPDHRCLYYTGVHTPYPVPVLPAVKQLAVLTGKHVDEQNNDHLDPTRLLARVSALWFWDTMASDVHQHVVECEGCAFDNCFDDSVVTKFKP